MIQLTWSCVCRRTQRDLFGSGGSNKAQDSSQDGKFRHHTARYSMNLTQSLQPSHFHAYILLLNSTFAKID